MFKASLLLAVVVCAAGALAAPPRWHELSLDYNFEQYCKDFSKVYTSDAEKIIREKNFRTKLNSIMAHNAKGLSWREGVNHLTDYTIEELNSMKGYDKARGFAEVARRQATRKLPQQPIISPNKEKDWPSYIDWREKGVVSAVKDQGMCGSCWTFGTAETLESHYAISTGQLPVLSEQFSLNCVPNPNECGGFGGCEGGTPELIYQTLLAQKWNGLPSEWTDPYVSYNGRDYLCAYNASRGDNPKIAATFKSYVAVTPNSYSDVMDALVNHGPLAINVDANTWHGYETGVFNGCNQTNPDIDHVVQLVGYGTDDKLGDYWIVRNSWAPSWGELGYIRIHRTSSVQCGTDNHPLDGTGCKGAGPQMVCGTCGVLFDTSYPVVK